MSNEKFDLDRGIENLKNLYQEVKADGDEIEGMMCLFMVKDEKGKNVWTASGACNVSMVERHFLLLDSLFHALEEKYNLSLGRELVPLYVHVINELKKRYFNLSDDDLMEHMQKKFEKMKEEFSSHIKEKLGEALLNDIEKPASAREH